MALPHLLLALSLATLALALLLLAAARPILQTRIRYQHAAAASLLMILLGALAALIAGTLYATIRPFLASFFLRKFKLLGWWIDLDTAIVWTCGLCAGYTLALCLTVKARNSRRLATAMLAAIVTPPILAAAERLIAGSQLALAALMR